MEKITAVVLAAGAGKRMHSDVHKQYMMLHAFRLKLPRPVLFYALQAFAESAVTDIVVVVGAGEIDYCRKEIVEKYHIQKVCAVVEGGRERYHSVYEGLKAADGSDYVLIHDGARPLVTADIISRSIACVREGDSCVVGMPVKDTIKVVGADGFAKETPERSSLWQVQTPQTFPYGRIRKAYEKVMAQGDSAVTDDAMMLETAFGEQVRVIEGSYQNLKITTPEDIMTAELYLNRKSEKKC